MRYYLDTSQAAEYQDQQINHPIPDNESLLKGRKICAETMGVLLRGCSEDVRSTASRIPDQVILFSAEAARACKILCPFIHTPFCLEPLQTSSRSIGW